MLVVPREYMPAARPRRIRPNGLKGLASRHGETLRRCGPRHLFFFQAEDGIRHYKVTGVQTCALPICLMAKGGAAAAFAKQGTNLRVGFASINSDPVVRLDVAQFTGNARKAFYNTMYPLGGTSSTPLREAMDKVGQYFASPRSGANPWLEDPTSSSSVEWTCRKSFHIMSTDGYWNGDAASGAASDNNDTFSGKTPPKQGASTGYDYSNTGSSSADPLVGKYHIDPYADGDTAIANTLADVAGYYWQTDLRPNA